MRRIALAGVLMAVIAGCGGQTKTTTVVGSAPAVTAAPAAAKAASQLPGLVTSRVEKSVLPVSCPNPGSGFVGTGFMVRTGVVTASHVLAACPPATSATPFQLGAGTGTVSTNDSTHDLALVTYLGQQYSRNPNPKPLQPESRPAYVGEPLALLGIPALPLFGNPFTPQQVTVVQGTVVATNYPQVLTLGDGAHETLTDAIQVASTGVSPGESGGPAIDSTGKVVGVIEGSGTGIATLTPVTDLTSPH